MCIIQGTCMWVSDFRLHHFAGGGIRGTFHFQMSWLPSMTRLGANTNAFSGIWGDRYPPASNILTRGVQLFRWLRCLACRFLLDLALSDWLPPCFSTRCSLATDRSSGDRHTTHGVNEPCTASHLRASRVFPSGVRSTHPQHRPDRQSNLGQIHITGFLSSASNVRRKSVCRSRELPRLTQVGPLSPEHSSNDIIQWCIGSFLLIDAVSDHLPYSLPGHFGDILLFLLFVWCSIYFMYCFVLYHDSGVSSPGHSYRFVSLIVLASVIDLSF